MNLPRPFRVVIVFCLVFATSSSRHGCQTSGSYVETPSTTLQSDDTAMMYSVNSNSSTVFPCHRTLQISVDGRPHQADSRDVIRLYVRQYPAEGSWPTHVATTQLVYVTEVVLSREIDHHDDETLSVLTASFDCEIFNDLDDVTVVGFCFKYVSIDDVTTRVREQSKLCLPSRQQRVDGGWSVWSTWSACSVTCGARGRKFRHRTCSEPSPSADGAFCRGSTLDWAPCRQPRCEPTRKVYQDTVDSPLATSSESSTTGKLPATSRSRSTVDLERCYTCGHCTLYADTLRNDSLLLSSTTLTDCFDFTTIADKTAAEDAHRTTAASIASSDAASTWNPRRRILLWTIQSVGGNVVQLGVRRRLHQLDLSDGVTTANRSSDMRRPERPTVQLRVRDGSGPLSELLLLTTSVDSLSADGPSEDMEWMLTSRRGTIIVELSEMPINETEQQFEESDSSDDDSQYSDHVTWTLTFTSLESPSVDVSQYIYNDNVNGTGCDVITVLGIVLFITSVLMMAMFVWHGRRHATVFNCCLRYHRCSDSTMTSNNVTSPISLPTSGSFTQPKHLTVGNDYLVGSYDRPIVTSMDCQTRDRPRTFATASSSGGACSRLIRSTDSRSRSNFDNRRRSRSPYSTRSTSRDRNRRARRVRPIVDVTSGHVTSDSCVNLAISHVLRPGDDDTGLCTVEVFVSGRDCTPYRAINSHC